MRDYKLIAIDMDGTLLKSDNTISSKTKEVINKAINQGIYVVFATGRMLKSAMIYSDRLNLKKPIISCNGAVITDDKKNIVYDKSIDFSIGEDIFNICKKNGVYCHCYDDEQLYTPKYLEEVDRFYNTGVSTKEQVKINVLNSIDELKGKNNIYKFLALDKDREKLLKLKNDLAKLDKLSISSSWSNNLEIMKKGVSKGNSLRILADMLNIKKSQIISFGDNYNDLSMFRNSGLGIAMKNANRDIKKYADFTTDSNDSDGVAKFIEEYVLL